MHKDQIVILVSLSSRGATTSSRLRSWFSAGQVSRLESGNLASPL